MSADGRKKRIKSTIHKSPYSTHRFILAILSRVTKYCGKAVERWRGKERYVCACCMHYVYRLSTWSTFYTSCWVGPTFTIAAVRSVRPSGGPLPFCPLGGRGRRVGDSRHLKWALVCVVLIKHLADVTEQARWGEVFWVFIIIIAGPSENTSCN